MDIFDNLENNTAMNDNTLDNLGMNGDILDNLGIVDKPNSIIKVIGVGGGGGNAVNHMYHEGIHDVSGTQRVTCAGTHTVGQGRTRCR